jgi:hypothetical protein
MSYGTCPPADLTASPSPNGRDGRGRFAPGNRGGPGNPQAAHVARLRSAMLEAVTPEDMQEIIARLVTMAKAGDVAAIREVLLRTLGRPLEADLIDRLESLERSIAHPVAREDAL